MYTGIQYIKNKDTSSKHKEYIGGGYHHILTYKYCGACPTPPTSKSYTIVRFSSLRDNCFLLDTKELEMTSSSLQVSPLPQPLALYVMTFSGTVLN